MEFLWLGRLIQEISLAWSSFKSTCSFNWDLIFEGLDHGFLFETKLLELIGNRHEMLELSTGLRKNGLGQARYWPGFGLRFLWQALCFTDDPQSMGSTPISIVWTSSCMWTSWCWTLLNRRLIMQMHLLMVMLIVNGKPQRTLTTMRRWWTTTSAGFWQCLNDP